MKQLQKALAGYFTPAAARKPGKAKRGDTSKCTHCGAAVTWLGASGWVDGKDSNTCPDTKRRHNG